MVGHLKENCMHPAETQAQPTRNTGGNLPTLPDHVQIGNQRSAKQRVAKPTGEVTGHETARQRLFNNPKSEWTIVTARKKVAKQKKSLNSGKPVQSPHGNMAPGSSMDGMA